MVANQTTYISGLPVLYEPEHAHGPMCPISHPQKKWLRFIRASTYTGKCDAMPQIQKLLSQKMFQVYPKPPGMCNIFQLPLPQATFKASYGSFRSIQSDFHESPSMNPWKSLEMCRFATVWQIQNVNALAAQR